MKRRMRAWKAFLPVLAAAVISLVLTGCANNAKQPKSEHPTKTEHPSGEHPTKEQPPKEHPTSEHPK